jgi:hypothetical protein
MCVKIKICGVGDLVAATAAVRAGVDALGFVFAASPRRVAPSEARRIAADLPEHIERVAVFRLAPVDEIRRVLDEFPADRVQVEPDYDRLAAFGPRLLPVLHDDGSPDGAAGASGRTGGTPRPSPAAAPSCSPAASTPTTWPWQSTPCGRGAST